MNEGECTRCGSIITFCAPVPTNVPLYRVCAIVEKAQALTLLYE